MKGILLVLSIGIGLLSACSSEDPMIEINQLVADKKTGQAKEKYKELVDQADNPNVWREYVKFLFEHNQFHDFKREAREYLAKNAQDLEIRNLQFDFYAKLATDAEKSGSYGTAMEYIHNKLLNENYKEYRKWESKQVAIFSKWFNEVKEKGEESQMDEVISKMIVFGFGNLAREKDEERYVRIMARTEGKDAHAGEEAAKPEGQE